MAPSLLAALQRAFLLPSLPISSYVPLAFLMAGVSVSFFREFTPKGMSFWWAPLPSCSRKVGGASQRQCLRLRKTRGDDPSKDLPRSPSLAAWPARTCSLLPLQPQCFSPQSRGGPGKGEQSRALTTALQG